MPYNTIKRTAVIHYASSKSYVNLATKWELTLPLSKKVTTASENSGNISGSIKAALFGVEAKLDTKEKEIIETQYDSNIRTHISKLLENEDVITKIKYSRIDYRFTTNEKKRRGHELIEDNCIFTACGKVYIEECGQYGVMYTFPLSEQYTYYTIPLLLYFEEPMKEKKEGLYCTVICEKTSGANPLNIDEAEKGYKVIVLFSFGDEQKKDIFTLIPNEQYNTATWWDKAKDINSFYNHFTNKLRLDTKGKHNDTNWGESGKENLLTQKSSNLGNFSSGIYNLLPWFDAISPKAYKAHIFSKFYKFPKEENIPNSNILSLGDLNNIAGGKRNQDSKFINIETSQTDLVDHLRVITKSILNDTFAKIYFIVGDEGLGKSAYIDYLTTVYAKTFNNDNIVWIKIDLTDFRLRNGLTIYSLLKEKIYKILREWYINGGLGIFEENNDEEQELQIKELKEIKVKRREELSISKLKDFISEKCNIDISQIVGESSDDFGLYEWNNIKLDISNKNLLVKYIVDFMRHSGYSFIFFIDGFDEATHACKKQKVLDKWIDELSKISRTENDTQDFPLGVYVVSARSESIGSFTKYTSSPAVRELNTHTFKLKAVDLERIIEGRIDLINREIEYNSGEKGYRWTKEAFARLIRFTDKTVDDAFNRKLELKYDDILKLSNHKNNIRNFLRFYRSSIAETAGIIEEEFGDLIAFLEDKSSDTSSVQKKIVSKSYRILNLCGELLDYSYSAKRIGGNRIINEYEYESFPLIPNIFANMSLFDANLEDASEDAAFSLVDDKVFEPHILLIKIRILQILKIVKKAKLDDIVDIISSFFSYKQRKIEEYTKLMFLEGFIELSNDEYESYPSIYTGDITISYIGENILDSLMFKPDYLEICIQKALIPSAVSDEFTRILTKRTHGPLSDLPAISEYEKLKPYDYVAYLSYNILKFIALIKFIEDQENACYLSYYSKTIIKNGKNMDEIDLYKKFDISHSKVRQLFNLHKKFYSSYTNRIFDILNRNKAEMQEAFENLFSNIKL